MKIVEESELPLDNSTSGVAETLDLTPSSDLKNVTIDKLRNEIQDIIYIASTMLKNIENINFKQDGVNKSIEAENNKISGESYYSNKYGMDFKSKLPNIFELNSFIELHKNRSKIFKGFSFSDPAWDILLHLTRAYIENRRVPITEACDASDAPKSSAWRFIKQLEDANLIQREQDATDRRRSFVELSTKGLDAMASYFQKVGSLSPSHRD